MINNTAMYPQPSAPYSVEYYKDGQKQKIRRKPPPQLHSFEAGDTVTLTQKKNDFWKVEDEVKISKMNPRQPNTLKVEKEDGSYTFIPYFDVKMEKPFHPEPEKDFVQKEEEERKNDPIGSGYLLWP